MEKKCVLRKVGNSVGLTLPKEFLGKFELKEGSEVYLVTNEQGILMTPYDPEYEEIVKLLEPQKLKYNHLFRGGLLDEAD